jgi:hypothetical protein
MAAIRLKTSVLLCISRTVGWAVALRTAGCCVTNLRLRQSAWVMRTVDAREGAANVRRLLAGGAVLTAGGAVLTAVGTTGR